MFYVEAFPEELDAAWERNAVAILPLGALEWHGAHLPLGMDGITAAWFSEKLCERIDGVLLPTLYAPITTLPHRHSLQIPTEAFRMILDQTIEGLYASGARTIALVTGHYAQAHEIELYEAALRMMDDQEDLRVFAASPLEVLGDDRLLDHAGKIETSQFQAIRPDLVRLEQVPDWPKPKVDAILGDHPRLATPAEGRELLATALEAWVDWIGSTTMEQLLRHYRKRFDAYEEYADKFYEGSWEDAILRWWETK